MNTGEQAVFRRHENVQRRQFTGEIRNTIEKREIKNFPPIVLRRTEKLSGGKMGEKAERERNSFRKRKKRKEKSG